MNVENFEQNLLQKKEIIENAGNYRLTFENYRSRVILRVSLVLNFEFDEGRGARPMTRQ